MLTPSIPSRRYGWRNACAISATVRCRFSSLRFAPNVTSPFLFILYFFFPAVAREKTGKLDTFPFSVHFVNSGPPGGLYKSAPVWYHKFSTAHKYSKEEA